MYYIGIPSAVIINDSMEFQLLPLSKGDTSVRDFAHPSGEEPSLTEGRIFFIRNFISRSTENIIHIPDGVAK